MAPKTLEQHVQDVLGGQALTICQLQTELAAAIGRENELRARVAALEAEKAAMAPISVVN